jgi:lipopolysaccharide assembly protein A
MRQFIGFVVFVPLAVVVGIFAVENRAPLSLEIWPLPGVHQMWASVWVLGLLAIGTVIGMAIGWMAGSGARRRARRAERTNRTLERQLTDRDSQTSSASSDVSPGVLPAPENQAARIAQRED